jgi:hypothetical protein
MYSTYTYLPMIGRVVVLYIPYIGTLHVGSMLTSTDKMLLPLSAPPASGDKLLMIVLVIYRLFNIGDH